jgi:phage gp36-like protein
MNLFLTALDLSLEGVPSAALSRVTSFEGRACIAASNKAADYLRGRYSLPLIATVGGVEWVPVAGSTATGIVSVELTDPTEPVLQAYGVVLSILSSTTGRISTDGGLLWGNTFVIPAGGSVDLQNGLTVTFSSGTWYVGDVYRCSVSYGSLTSYCAQIAAQNLLRVRGYSIDGTAYKAIDRAAEEALKWLMDVRDLRTDPGLTDTQSGDGSEMFLMDPEIQPTPNEVDRRWNSYMGRAPDVSQQ